MIMVKCEHENISNTAVEKVPLLVIAQTQLSTNHLD